MVIIEQRQIGGKNEIVINTLLFYTWLMKLKCNIIYVHYLYI